VRGSYFEACNCDAVCPCRQVGGRNGGRSTYGVCQFALSWQIRHGHAGATSLDDLAVVMAGWYDDDEAGSPWRVALYVDDRADAAQLDALAAIFLGRAGGTTFDNFAKAIGVVHGVRRARITLDHRPRRWRMSAETYVNVEATVPVELSESVSCGIPGHDRAGVEVVPSRLAVDDGPLAWDVHERCGFASDFDYAG
jgi:hypothetical protein